METNASKSDTLSLLQLIMGGLGLLLVAAVALLLVVVGALRGFGDGAVSSASGFSVAVVALLFCLLLLPSVILPVYRLWGRPLPNLRIPQPFRLATLLMFGWPALVALGWFVSERTDLGWLALPVLSILAIGIPVWWLVELGRRGLPGGSLQRPWGLLGYGVAPNMILILSAELLVITALALFYMLYASSRPGLLAELEGLAQRIRAMGDDPQQLMQFARTIFSRPGAVFGVVAIGAVLMPMLEELLKPLGMWFIAGRIQTPAEGFTAGLVCGGAFAFVESLNLATGMAASNWTSVALARVGAGLLHVTASGLVGWGMASAWTQGRYLRQALTFLAAVLLHGLWNFFGLLMGLWSFLPGGVDLPQVEGVDLTTLAGTLVLGAMAALMLVVLARMNIRLRRETRAAQTETVLQNSTVSAESANLLVESKPAAQAQPLEDASASRPEEIEPRQGDNKL